MISFSSRCALANELARTRAKVITGMKEMFRKRYATIHATSYSYERVSYPCKKKKNRKRNQKKHGLKRGRVFVDSDDNDCQSIDNLMTYDDGLSGE